MNQNGMKRSFAVATAFFFASRMLLILALFLSLWLPCKIVPSWSVEIPFLEPLFRWDTGWYLSIVEQGYHYVLGQPIQFNVAFFPLYPLLVKGIHLASDWPIPWIGVCLSNLFLWGALFFLHRLLSEDFSSRIADWATSFLAFFPTTIFCSVMYTESTYLFLSVLAFFALRRGHSIRFGLVGGLLTATRLTGIAIGLPALVEWWKTRPPRLLLGMALVPTGLLGYMIFLQGKFGDALAFLHAMHAPGWDKTFGFPFLSILRAPFASIAKLFLGRFDAGSLDIWFLILFLIAAFSLYCRLKDGRILREAGRPYLAYLVAGLFIPLASNSLVSLTRYLMVLFPAYLLFAFWCEERKVFRWVLPAFAVLSMLFAVLFSRWYWAG